MAWATSAMKQGTVCKCTGYWGAQSVALYAATSLCLCVRPVVLGTTHRPSDSCPSLRRAARPEKSCAVAYWLAAAPCRALPAGARCSTPAQRALHATLSRTHAAPCTGLEEVPAPLSNASVPCGWARLEDHEQALPLRAGCCNALAWCALCIARKAWCPVWLPCCLSGWCSRARAR